MLTIPSRTTRLSLWLALLAAGSACGDSGSPLSSETPPPTPIAEVVWHMHSVDTIPLPARISDRFVGVTLEETFLDSAQLSVDYVTGFYQQRYWTRVNHTGVEDRREFVFDEGTFAQTVGGFTFTSASRERVFTLLVPEVGKLVSAETMSFWSGAPTITGIYRPVRP